VNWLGDDLNDNDNDNHYDGDREDCSDSGNENLRYVYSFCEGRQHHLTHLLTPCHTKVLVALHAERHKLARLVSHGRSYAKRASKQPVPSVP